MAQSNRAHASGPILYCTARRVSGPIVCGESGPRVLGPQPPGACCTKPKYSTSDRKGITFSASGGDLGLSRAPPLWLLRLALWLGWTLYCQNHPHRPHLQKLRLPPKKLAPGSHAGTSSFFQFLTRFLYGKVASQSPRNTFWV